MGVYFLKTIYYPHFDLENKGFFRVAPNHVLNIKLLSLLADKILIRSSHLLNTQLTNLHIIENELYDFILDGKVETAIYNTHDTLEDYFENKIEETVYSNLRHDYKIKSDYLKNRIFNNNPQLIYIDNEFERQNFHLIYTETNLIKAKQSSNRYLIRSAQEFQEEMYKRMNQKGTYLNLSEVDIMIYDLIKKGKIKKSHYNFFLDNQIGTYYYCGSMASSSTVAYNPYFQNIQFEKISSHIEYTSSYVYDPEFLLNILLRLKIINTAEDIEKLSSKDIDLIHKQKAWKWFQEIFSVLYNDAITFDEFTKREEDIQKKIEKIKKFVFGLSLGAVSDAAISSIVGMFLFGHVAGAISLILSLLIEDSKMIQQFQESTTDRIIERIYATKEPFYVITSKIKRIVNDMANEK